MTGNNQNKRGFTKTLSPIVVWAFSIGTSVGWGSMVVTNNSYLGQAGPLGSVVGLIIGTVIMLLISHNYSYMINAYPDCGGVYTYSKEIFGYDHGFLTAWFLALTYFAVLWANATSLPLFARYFVGDIFRFQKLYTIFGYEVYLGEALLTIGALLIFAFFCIKFKKAVSVIMAAMALLFTIGIIVCFVAAITGSRNFMQPAFLPESSAFSQIVKIACISPWAFIGFESVSHSVEEFSFHRSKISRILAVSVISTGLLYILIILLSVTAYPPQYDSWLSYIRDLPNLQGIDALPAFYAARHYLGNTGITILMLSLLSLIFTSFIGNTTALSRLIYALAKDEVMPSRFCSFNKHGIPHKAIILIAAISVFVPFLGRTAIGWIVDVTTLGATLVCAFVSAAAMKHAKSGNDQRQKISGLLGLIICIFFELYMLLPNLFGTRTLEAESFFLFVVWSVLGFIYFHIILRHDSHKRFGKSIIVWIALLSLILFVSLVWMSSSIMDATDKGMTSVGDYYKSLGLKQFNAPIVESQMEMIRQISAQSILVVVVLFALSVGILLNNYSLMSRKATHSELQLGKMRNLALTDSLTGVKSKLAYSIKEKELEEQIANGSQHPFAMVVCDVNGLKYINDTFGHKAGDAYINQAVELICDIFKHSPVYRTGGDEFIVILTEKDYEERSALLGKLHDKSVANIQNNKVVVAAGLADFVPGSSENLHEVIEKADVLMYKEKQLLKSMGAATRL